MVKGIRCILLILLSFVIITGWSVSEAATDYDNPEHWAYRGERRGEVQKVDVFFICPTVYFGNENQPNMPMESSEVRKQFLGAINMEKGIYDAETNFYAPYYQQVGLQVYNLETTVAQPYFEIAYQDVKAAFSYYLREYNQGRPIILAGFSQGADMVIRLLKDMYEDEQLQKQLVAAYAIGWRITPEELKRYPQLKMAKGQYDTGIIVSFNTEAPNIQTSLLVPEKTLGINPLNWKTTSEQADKSLNKGAVFTDYAGSILKEVPYLTGAYLDPNRGTLKVTDVSAEEYPPMLEVFDKGVYHIYDYLFFYRNLQENVKDRIHAFMQKAGR